MNNLFTPIWTSELWKPVWGDAISIWPNDLAAMQRLFSNGELGGYWPADPAYAYEDSAGTMAASVNGVVGIRYDQSQGTVAAARRNLLTYSEDFSNNEWAGNNVTIISASAIAPNGALSASKMVSSAYESWHYGSNYTAISILTTYTYSIYAKVAEETTCFVNFPNDGTLTTFNLSTETVAPYSGVSASIQFVGNGWYRLILTYTSGGSETVCNPFFGLRTGSYTGDGASGMYIWGAQLEVGASATPYQKIITGAADCLPGNHAIQATTANKPYLRLTPTTNKYWYDSNTATGALTATFSGALGSACTVATVTPEGVSILESQTVGATYNICPAYGYNADVLIIDRALTVAEKALVTRVMQRSVPSLGSNLAVNGSFATDTDWTKGTGWSIDGTAAKSAGTASNLTQTLGVSGNQYRVTADITRTAGTVGAYNGTAQIGATAATETAAKYAMKTTSTTVGFRGDASFAGTVDNAVIQEIL